MVEKQKCNKADVDIEVIDGEGEDETLIDADFYETPKFPALDQLSRIPQPILSMPNADSNIGAGRDILTGNSFYVDILSIRTT
jgi:hypothetical protein